MGSVTYEWVLAHGRAWPYAGKPTWVLSSRELERPEGEDVDVRIVDARVPDLIEEMRRGRRRASTSGSSEAATSRPSSPTTACSTGSR